MTYQEFVNKYNGVGTDYDGVAGVQCVDLIKLYLNKVFGLNPGAGEMPMSTMQIGLHIRLNFRKTLIV